MRPFLTIHTARLFLNTAQQHTYGSGARAKGILLLKEEQKWLAGVVQNPPSLKDGCGLWSGCNVSHCGLRSNLFTAKICFGVSVPYRMKKLPLVVMP